MGTELANKSLDREYLVIKGRPSFSILRHGLVARLTSEQLAQTEVVDQVKYSWVSKEHQVPNVAVYPSSFIQGKFYLPIPPAQIKGYTTSSEVYLTPQGSLVEKSALGTLLECVESSAHRRFSADKPIILSKNLEGSVDISLQVLSLNSAEISYFAGPEQSDKTKIFSLDISPQNISEDLIPFVKRDLTGKYIVPSKEAIEELYSIAAETAKRVNIPFNWAKKGHREDNYREQRDALVLLLKRAGQEAKRDIMLNDLKSIYEAAVEDKFQKEIPKVAKELTYAFSEIINGHLREDSIKPRQETLDSFNYLLKYVQGAVPSEIKTEVAQLMVLHTKYLEASYDGQIASNKSTETSLRQTNSSLLRTIKDNLSEIVSLREKSARMVEGRETFIQGTEKGLDALLEKIGIEDIPSFKEKVKPVDTASFIPDLDDDVPF